MPGVSGVTVVTNARAFYTTRAAAGASGARHSLRPLFSEGANFLQNSGASRRENAESYSNVIARAMYPDLTKVVVRSIPVFDRAARR